MARGGIRCSRQSALVDRYWLTYLEPHPLPVVALMSAREDDMKSVDPFGEVEWNTEEPNAMKLTEPMFTVRVGTVSGIMALYWGSSIVAISLSVISGIAAYMEGRVLQSEKQVGEKEGARTRRRRWAARW